MKTRHAGLVLFTICCGIARFIDVATEDEVAEVKAGSGLRRLDIRTEVLRDLRVYFYIAGGIGVLVAAGDWFKERKRPAGAAGESPGPAPIPPAGDGPQA